MTVQKLGYIVLISLVIAAGCAKTEQAEPVTSGFEKNLLTIDFEEGKTLRYKFVSDRQISINWDPASEKGAQQLDTDVEHFEMTVAYTPIEVDPYGLTKLQVVCESIDLTRTAARGSFVDAALKFLDKPFTISVTPSGKIADSNELEKVLSEIGVEAFRKQSTSNIKEPDMISDIIATQWFMWETIASIPEPTKGVDINDQWETVTLIPLPTVTRFAKKATNTLTEIQQTPKGTMAVIKSQYSPAEIPEGLPSVYRKIGGTFQMAGKFGFLGGYQLLTLEGSGEEVFNIDLGVLVSQKQQYVSKFEAAPLMGLPVKPEMTVKQTVDVKLVEDESR